MLRLSTVSSVRHTSIKAVAETCRSAHVVAAQKLNVSSDCSNISALDGRVSYKQASVNEDESRRTTDEVPAAELREGHVARCSLSWTVAPTNILLQCQVHPFVTVTVHFPYIRSHVFSLPLSILCQQININIFACFSSSTVLPSSLCRLA